VTMPLPVGLYSAIVTALYRRERTGGRIVRPHCRERHLVARCRSRLVCDAKFFGLHRSQQTLAMRHMMSTVPLLMSGRLMCRPTSWRRWRKPRRADLLTDPRFADPAEEMANRPAASPRSWTKSSVRSRWRIGTRLRASRHSAPRCAARKKSSIDPQCGQKNNQNNIIVPPRRALGKLTSDDQSPLGQWVTKALPSALPSSGRQ